MFAVEVRDHIMIAHSLPAPVFGPAQGMHGATFVVDAAFFTEDLDAHGLVVDIGLATEALAAALAPLRYRNLDELPGLRRPASPPPSSSAGTSSTRSPAAARAGGLGDGGRLRRLRVTLHESHVARAWYEADL